MVATTARDALLAEILGDVLTLQDSVNSMTNMLPAQTELVESKITGLIGLLQMAGDTYKEQIKAYTNTEAEKIREQMEEDLLAAQDKLEKTISDATLATLNKIELAAKQTIKNEITNPTLKALSSLRPSLLKILTLCLASSLIGGLISGVIIHVTT